MQAFINWVANWFEQFFINLQLAAEWLIGFLMNLLEAFFTEFLIPVLDAMCSYCATDLSSAAEAAHQVLSSIYPFIQWYIPLAEIVGLCLCYIGLYFLLWPMKLVVRAVMALL